MKNNSTGAGKGDKARNNYSSQFWSNYDQINWGGGKKSKISIKKRGREVVVRKNGKIIGIQA